MDDPKFANFNVTTTPYKIVNDQEIALYVLIPKGVYTGKRPVLVHFHGGFLITGHAIYPDWTAQWSLDYATLHSAIRVSANYRLLPESNGLDILSDVRDLWTWVENDLPAYLKRIGSDITPDYESVATYGESAGGYLAIQSGLMRPDLVKSVIAAYPMTYLDRPWFSVASTDKSPMGAPQIPKAVFDQHLSSMEPGKIFTGAFPPARMDIALPLLQNGLLPQIMGTDASLYPAKEVEKMKGDEKVPLLLIMHGTEDSAVPCEHSVDFVKFWEEKFGQGSAVGKFESGDHGFDGAATLETPWLKDGLASISKVWIK
ncbi:Alpha/Beta hydrolase protein [Rhexocercosporidium sp. MPI-PUGE-AT-0058]|nr:Alpha/Beta hydrolase protein [Rhexocercosporidium sp. MPI-PUGE-AT-0058]